MHLKLSIVLILLSLTACSSTNKEINQTTPSTKANIVVQSTVPMANVETTHNNISNKDSVSDSNKQIDLNITSNQFQITYPFELTKYIYRVRVDELAFLDYNRPEAKEGDDCEVIGGIDKLGTPEAMGKYNHSYLVSKKEVKGKILTYQYLLQFDSKGTDPNQLITQSHVYLVMNDKLVYDIWFRTDYISEDKLLEIAQTFKLINIPNDLTTTAKTGESQ